MPEDIISTLLNSEDDLRNHSRVNYYSLFFSRRTNDEHFAIALPEEINVDVREEICNTLVEFKSYVLKKLDPMAKEENTYEFVDLIDVNETWSAIKTLIEHPHVYRDSEARKKVTMANWGVVEFYYNERTYYIFSKQISLDRLFKGRMVFMGQQDGLKKVSKNKFFTFSPSVDFILCENEDKETGVVYIFKRDSFMQFFGYYDHLKKVVKENIQQVYEWTFLDSPSVIIDSIEQKNVVGYLYRVFMDEAYMRQIKEIKPKVLKKRLIEKSDGIFSSKDFNGEKLCVTKHNLLNIVKAFAKGFHYNFFTDKAEEI